jgi:hypothetical protein
VLEQWGNTSIAAEQRPLRPFGYCHQPRPEFQRDVAFAGQGPAQHGFCPRAFRFGHLKLAAPSLGLVVVLPLAYFHCTYGTLSFFGALAPFWISNAFAVIALLRNKRSTRPF